MSHSSPLGSVVVVTSRAAQAAAADPANPTKPKEPKAWINGKGMCVFPFAAEDFPITPRFRRRDEPRLPQGDQAARRFEHRHRRGRRVPQGGLAEDRRVRRGDRSRAKAPSPRDPQADRPGSTRALRDARPPHVGRTATVNMDLIATDAGSCWLRTTRASRCSVLGVGKNGRISMEVTLDDVERLLLVAAQGRQVVRAGGRPGAAEHDRRRDRPHHPRRPEALDPLRRHPRRSALHGARLDIDDKLNGKVSDSPSTATTCSARS